MWVTEFEISRSGLIKLLRDLDDLNSIRGKAKGGQYQGIINWDQNMSNTA